MLHGLFQGRHSAGDASIRRGRTSSSSQQSPTRPDSASEPMPLIIWRAMLSMRELCQASQSSAELAPSFTAMPVSTSVEAFVLVSRTA